MSQWVGLLVALTALLAFLGTGTVFVLSGRQKVRVDGLEKSNADLRNDVGDRDRRIEFLEHENQTKTAEIEALKAHVEALERMKTGEAFFQAVHDQVAAHSAKVLANHEKIMSEVGVLRAQNRDILRLLADQRRDG